MEETRIRRINELSSESSPPAEVREQKQAERIKLTNANVGKLQPRADGKERWVYDTDEPKLAVRVMPDGKKVFYVYKRATVRGKGNRPLKRKIGDYPSWSVDVARKEAKQIVVSLDQHIDPNAQIEAVKNATKTLGECFKEVLAHRNIKESTRQQYEKLMNRCFSDWLNKSMLDITPDMISKRHAELSKKTTRYTEANKAKHGEWTGKGQADYAMRVLRLVFSYACRRIKGGDGKPLIHENPVKELSHGKQWNNLGRRKNFITDAQMAAWLKAVEGLPDETETMRDYLLLCLFTGMRKEEAAQLKWSEVKLDDGVIHLPGSRTKNGNDHYFPLSTKAIEILRGRSKKGEYVFPGDGKHGHMVDPRKAMNTVTRQSGVEFTSHTLRNTYITKGESLDISVYTIKLLVNHSIDNDVTGGYVGRDLERMRQANQRITDAFVQLRGG